MDITTKLKRGTIITFELWEIEKSNWEKRIHTAKITYVYKTMGPLGISIVPEYFYGIENGKRTMFWVGDIYRILS